MMVPLINYIDTLCDKQKKQLELLSFIDKRSANALVPELYLFCEALDEKKLGKLMNLKSFQRFDYFMKCYENVFSDRMLAHK